MGTGAEHDPAGEEKRFRSFEREIGGRIFRVDLLVMTNGCFASISEDRAPRMGAISVTIKSGERATTSALLPESKGRIFAGMVGELLANKVRGIAVVSLYLREELDPATMKTLINEVQGLLRKD